MSPDEFRAQAATLSQQWSQLSDNDKEPYVVQAAWENQQREKLAEIRLLSSCESKQMAQMKPEVEEAQIKEAKDIIGLQNQVGCKALRKSNLKRLQINQMNFKSHAFWDTECQLADSTLATDFL